LKLQYHQFEIAISSKCIRVDRHRPVRKRSSIFFRHARENAILKIFPSTFHTINIHNIETITMVFPS